MSLSEKMHDFSGRLSKWEKEIGLPVCKLDFDVIDHVLNMSHDQVGELTSREAAEYAFILCQYTLVLQYRENRCRAFAQWSGHVRGEISTDDRDRLLRLTRDAELKLTQIAFVGRKIELMGQALQTVCRSKAKEESQ